MKAIKFLLAMFFLFIVVSFGTANINKVSLNYWANNPLLGYDKIMPDTQPKPGEIVKPRLEPIKVSLWIIMFSCVIAGFLMAYIIMIQDVIQSRSQFRKMRKAKLKLEKKLSSLQQEEPANNITYSESNSSNMQPANLESAVEDNNNVKEAPLT